MTIDDEWQRLSEHEGETVTQIRGGAFAYFLTLDDLIPDRTDWAIPRSHLQEALDLVPLRNTVPVQHLYGRSHL